jgi:chromosome segregation ATPase
MEGDRKAYSEESRILIGKQRATIEKLKIDNQNLQDELKLLEQRNEDRKKNGIQSKKAESMAEIADSLQKKIKAILDEISVLDRETGKMDQQIDVERAKLGGVNAAQVNNAAINKQVRVLENRLEKALVKFNKALAVNKRLRGQIDNLRRERLVFDNIYHKFERELMEQKKQMADIIEASNAAYEARDEAQSKILVLREKAEKESQAYVQEMKELDRILEQDRRLKEFMATKNSNRVQKVNQNANAKKGAKDTLGTKFPSQETIHVPLDTYESAFTEIRKVTGISDIGELVARFKAVEDQNFSLFNYVNEINNEIELHAEEIVQIQNHVNQLKIEAVAIEEERKKKLALLEVFMIHVGQTQNNE